MAFSLLLLAGEAIKPQHHAALAQSSLCLDSRISRFMHDFLGAFIFEYDLVSTRDSDPGQGSLKPIHYEDILAPYETK